MIDEICTKWIHKGLLFFYTFCLILLRRSHSCEKRFGSPERVLVLHDEK